MTKTEKIIRAPGPRAESPDAPRPNGIQALQQRYPRLANLEAALKFGYSPADLHWLMDGLEAFERRLTGLFGDPVQKVFFRNLIFSPHDPALNRGRVGLSMGRDLKIDTAACPPGDLIRKLALFLPHEYAHALTINRGILWESLPEKVKTDLRRGYPQMAQGFDSITDSYAARFFFYGLKEGIHNPFIAGLRKEDIDDICNLFYECYGFSADNNIENEVAVYTVELITERITNLISGDMPNAQALTRESIQECSQSLIELMDRSDDHLYYPLAAYVFVYAQKTGNADLAKRLEEKGLSDQPAFQKMCSLLSEIWEQIQLRPNIRVSP